MDLSVSEVRLADRRLFTGFIRDITERKRLEKEILEISEREQRRIGHDLHDGLCQHLAGIELMSQVLEQKLARRSKAAAARASDIAKNVREAIGHTRLLARGLSPVTLESEGLMSALQELALSTEKIFRVTCRFDCDPPVLVSDFPAATHLFRLAQEAVSNALKHGQAKRILIRLKEERGQMILSVIDNGSGFSPQRPKSKGMGLRIMQSRAGMIGGTLAIERNAAGGTSVTVRTPNVAVRQKTSNPHARKN
jgi:signal transduction histidine kinase